VWSCAAALYNEAGLRRARPAAARTARQRGGGDGEPRRGPSPPLAPGQGGGQGGGGGGGGGQGGGGGGGAAGKKRARPADCGCGPPPLQRCHSSGLTAAAPAELADAADVVDLVAAELECADEGAEAGPPTAGAAMAGAAVAAGGVAGAAVAAGGVAAGGAAGATGAAVAPMRPRSPPPQHVHLRLRGVRLPPAAASWRTGEVLSGVPGCDRPLRQPLHQPEPLPPPGGFQPGDAVVLRGLSSRPALNGREARVVSRNEATGLCAISTLVRTLT